MTGNLEAEQYKKPGICALCDKPGATQDYGIDGELVEVHYVCARNAIKAALQLKDAIRIISGTCGKILGEGIRPHKCGLPTGHIGRHRCVECDHTW